MNSGFVKMDSMFAELYERLGTTFDVKKSTLKNMIQGRIRKLGNIEQAKDEIGLFEVKDYQLNFPKNFCNIIQVAFRDTTPRKIKRTEIVKWTKQCFDGSGCELEINLKCPECHETSCSCEGTEMILDVDDMFRRAHPEYQYGHMNWLYSTGGLFDKNQVSSYHPEFILARYASSDFFNADFHIKGCLNLDQKLCAYSPIEYKVDFPKIRFNRKEGQIIMAYKASRVDEEGYLYVPDCQEFYDAVQWFIISELSHTKFLQDMKNRGAFTAYKDAQNEYKQQAASAMEVLANPVFNKWMDFLANNYHRPIRDLKTSGYYNHKVPDMYEHNLRRLQCHR